MRAVLLLLFVVFAPTTAEAQRCDPFSATHDLPIPPQLQLRKTCGNGRIDTYATACTKTESGGCGHPMRSSTSCTKTQEVCDGSTLGGQRCASLGYAGGTLRCASTCDRFALERCTLCPSTASCREKTIAGDDFEDLTLIAQHDTVRAFWYDDTGYYVADVDARGGLGARTKLGDMGSFRIIPVQVGTSALAIVGAMATPQLSVVPERGAPRLVPLPGQVGSLFMPVLPIPNTSRALVIAGEPYEAHVLIVDRLGARQPLSAVYARNGYRRAALVPLAAGAHQLRWATYALDVVAKPGDLLWLMHDYQTHLNIVRNGRVVSEGTAATATTPVAPGEVVVDGRVVASFGTTEDVIAGVTHALPPKVPPSTQLLAPRAYEAGTVSTARTATRIVHAARVSHGTGDEDPPLGATLAIAVGAAKP